MPCGTFCKFNYTYKSNYIYKLKTILKSNYFWSTINILQIRGGVAMLFEYLKTYKAQIFNRGQSAKVFKEAHDKNAAICVITNSEPYVAILPHKLYLEMLEKMKLVDGSSKEGK